jgi:hypothetical protein
MNNKVENVHNVFWHKGHGLESNYSRKNPIKLFVWVFQITYLNLSIIVVNSRAGEMILEELCFSLVFLEKLVNVFILKQHIEIWKLHHYPEYRWGQGNWWLPLDLNNPPLCVKFIDAPKYQFFEVLHLRYAPEKFHA